MFQIRQDLDVGFWEKTNTMLPQKQAEEAIVSNFSETEHEGGGKEEGREDEQQQQHSMLSMKSFLWHGGSAWDAWFSCASNQVPPRTPQLQKFSFRGMEKWTIFFNVCSRIVQVAQVLLTLPYSFSQMGMLSGILLQIFYGFLGSWTAYLISVLYVEYRSRKEKENVSFKNHVIQVIRLFNFLFFHFSYFCVILGWYWIGIRSHHHHLHLIHKARTQVKKYLRSLFQNLFSYCVGIWIAVVWSAWWVTGSILESCRTCLQLYFPLIRICHTTDSLCKVTFFLHSFYFLSRCKINNWVLLIFNYL